MSVAVGMGGWEDEPGWVGGLDEGDGVRARGRGPDGIAAPPAFPHARLPLACTGVSTPTVMDGGSREINRSYTVAGRTHLKTVMLRVCLKALGGLQQQTKQTQLRMSL